MDTITALLGTRVELGCDHQGTEKSIWQLLTPDRKSSYEVKWNVLDPESGKVERVVISDGSGSGLNYGSGDDIRDRVELVQNTKALVLHRITEHDQGIYQCQIFAGTNSMSGTTSRRKNLVVEIPPKITQFPNETFVLLRSFSTKKFACSAIGFPRPSIEWLKDNALITSSHGDDPLGIHTNHVNGSATHSLEVVLDNQNHNQLVGAYTCTATSAGFDHKVTRTMRVFTAEAPTVTLLSSDLSLMRNTTNLVYIKQFESVTLNCAASGLPELMQMEWLYEGRSIDGNKLLNIKKTIKSNKLNKTSLTIVQVIRQFSSKIECKVCNACDKPSIFDCCTTSTPVKLIVEYPPDFFSSEIQSIGIDTDGTVECRFNCVPPISNVTWRRQDNRPIPSHNLVDSGQLLKFLKVSEQHGGSYECKGKNDVGESDWKTINVNPTVAPINILALRSDISYDRSKQTAKGGIVVLQCEFDTNRVFYNQKPSSIQWRRANGKQLRSGLVTKNGIGSFNDGLTTVSTITSKLTINSLQYDDHGIYECYVPYDAGEVVDRTTIFVNNVPPQPPVNLNATCEYFDAMLHWIPGWMSESADNGQTFEVQYRLKSSVSGSSQWETLETNTNSVVAHHLIHASLYEYRVKGINQFGAGSYSDPFRFQTKASSSTARNIPIDPTTNTTYYPSLYMHIPAEPRPYKPKEFTLTYQNSIHTLDLEWDVPLANERTPKFYRLEVRLSNSGANAAAQSKSGVKRRRRDVSRQPKPDADGFNDLRYDNGSEIEIEQSIFTLPLKSVENNLRAHKYYDFRLRGYNPLSWSEPSEVQSMRIPGAAPYSAILFGVLGGILFLIVCLILSILAIKWSKRKSEERRAGKSRVLKQMSKNGNGSANYESVYEDEGGFKEKEFTSSDSNYGIPTNTFMRTAALSHGVRTNPRGNGTQQRYSAYNEYEASLLRSDDHPVESDRYSSTLPSKRVTMKYHSTKQPCNADNQGSSYQLLTERKPDLTSFQMGGMESLV